MRKKIISALIALCMIFTIMPITAFAADVTEHDLRTGSITITNNGDYKITQSNSETFTNNTITVSAEKANITIEDLNIIANGAILLSKNSSVNLTLSGSSTLTSINQYAGLWVPEGASLTISSADSNGTDSLTVTGGSFAAGIGGCDVDVVGAEGATCGTVNITSGKVNATGGYGAAGIGGGNGGGSGTIVISAESNKFVTVVAQGGNSSAGIGIGRNGSGGSITISGKKDGVAKVDATGGAQGAGIGGKVDSITISADDNYSAVVTALSGANGGAGIGGNFASRCGNIEITGGNITATGSEVGIGDRVYETADSSITIKDSIVFASCNMANGYAMGGEDVSVAVTGGKLLAHGGSSSYGIYSNNGTIALNNANALIIGGKSSLNKQHTFNYTDLYKWRTTDSAAFDYSDTTEYAYSSSTHYLDIACVVFATGIRINRSEITLTASGTEALSSTVFPDNATEGTVIWTSSDESVATVDETGIVTAIGAGTATITATIDSFSATCKVTVTVPVTGVTLDKTTLDLTVGDSDTLTATIAPENATNKTITWTSSDTSVATVDENGQVTAIGEGTATITATTANGISATCAVSVEAASEPTPEPEEPEETNPFIAFIRRIISFFENIFRALGLIK